jgi:hypothetical protein
MTQIDPTPEEVAKALEDCCPCYAAGEGGCQQHVACSYQKWGARTIRHLSAALDAAEAEKRAAVAAKVEEIAKRVMPLLGQYIADDVLPCYDIESEVYLMDPEAGQANAAFVDHAIRALSDTDALAEYVKRDAAEAEKRAAYKEGWRFAYRQWERTGSVPDPEYAPHNAAIRENE